jgi:hypothetical protein
MTTFITLLAITLLAITLLASDAGKLSIKQIKGPGVTPATKYTVNSLCYLVVKRLFYLYI